MPFLLVFQIKSLSMNLFSSSIKISLADKYPYVF